MLTGYVCVCVCVCVLSQSYISMVLSVYALTPYSRRFISSLFFCFLFHHRRIQNQQTPVLQVSAQNFILPQFAPSLALVVGPENTSEQVDLFIQVLSQVCSFRQSQKQMLIEELPETVSRSAAIGATIASTLESGSAYISDRLIVGSQNIGKHLRE
jgi:hypothetical protein